MNYVTNLDQNMLTSDQEANTVEANPLSKIYH